jgi:hypothetical protein
MTDIYHNGKKLERIDLTFDAQAAPIISPQPLVEAKPPVDDKPPVRPVEPDPPSAVNANVIKRTLGDLRLSRPKLSTFMEKDRIYSHSFNVPVDVPLVMFGFIPQGSYPANFRVWVSRTPGGKPIDTKYGDVLANARRGQQFALAVAVRGLGGERRGAVVDKSTRYWLNMQSDERHPMQWRITGAF